ncbi:SCP2 sterol-binding domain-containing protein [Catenuloplanes sp. NPDC051500]|uniref:SCP2 sterol-binding domain-containing protein n=1 Tax=Catenuloplanes sp. NPDC051500 TaxID=3363959 RepID=UPI0037B9A1D0
MSVDQGNPAALGPYGFGRFVKAASTAELEALMDGARRTEVLDEVFRRMPEVFRADRAAGLRAVVHWSIGGRTDGGFDYYELVIANGTCTVSPARIGTPQLTLRLGAVDFLRLVTGNVHAVLLIMRGRLRTAGELALTTKFPSLFDPPKV